MRGAQRQGLSHRISELGRRMRSPRQGGKLGLGRTCQLVGEVAYRIGSSDGRSLIANCLLRSRTLSKAVYGLLRQEAAVNWQAMITANEAQRITYVAMSEKP